MDKLSALNELKNLAEQDVIKFSQYSVINDAVLNNNVSNQDKEDAKKLLANLVDEKKISFEIYDSLKNAIYIYQNNTTTSTPSPAFSSEPQHVVIENNKPLRGALVGFLLSFFLSAIGLILGIALGDEACKKSSIITFLVCTGVGIVIGVIWGIIVAAILGSNPDAIAYIALLI